MHFDEGLVLSANHQILFASVNVNLILDEGLAVSIVPNDSIRYRERWRRGEAILMVILFIAIGLSTRLILFLLGFLELLLGIFECLG